MISFAVLAAALVASSSSVYADAPGSWEFDALLAPYGTEKHLVRSSVAMRKSGKSKPAQWKTLIRTGDVYNGITYGQLMSKTNKPMRRLYPCITNPTGFCTNTSTIVSIL